MLLDGKIVLITGAAGGIGTATALLAAAEGARLALTDVSEDGVEATADQVRAAGGTAMTLPANLTDGGAVNAMVAAVVAEYGRLDGAFNNAASAVGRSGRAGAAWPSGTKKPSTARSL